MLLLYLAYEGLIPSSSSAFTTNIGSPLLYLAYEGLILFFCSSDNSENLVVPLPYEKY